MKIVSTTGGLEHVLSLADSVKMLCESGFTGIDLSMEPMYEADYKSKLSEIRRVAECYGVPFVQAHGPMPRILTESKEGQKIFMKRAERALLVAGELGIKNVVFHPIRFPFGNHADQLGYNVDIYSSLIPIAKASGAKIAIENMCGYKCDSEGNSVEHVCKDPQELCRFVDAFNDSSVTACLDTGHAFISGFSPSEFVRSLGNTRLGALHIHDSDGKNDLHTLPYSAGINWTDFTDALHEINYLGDITLEAVLFTRGMPPELLPQALNFMSKTADFIRSKVQRSDLLGVCRE